ncbi:anaphase-promoting complex subunit 10 isoform X2 [Oenanthe melanoleuca]|uniref:anaphase-promoting complex subunit 10 isoform X2 n=1 Tax=Oenanthe melanoleuca TaxID=2939378 RepID=UPI0024C0EEC2|nr:anaphase-promoting complex subunit 10 isoform X2 [Oenanthe melanoleuca]
MPAFPSQSQATPAPPAGEYPALHAQGSHSRRDGALCPRLAQTRGAGDDVPRVRVAPARAVPTPAANRDPREPPALRPGRGAASRPFSHSGSGEAAAQAGPAARHEEGGPLRAASIPVREEMTTPNKTPPGADPKQLERTGTVREIGSQAVWSLSSCKPEEKQQ